MIFLKKPYLELEKTYKESHQLFYIECDAIFSRLEKISQHNLEYYNFYLNLKETHALVIKDLEPKAKQSLSQLNQYLKDHQSRLFNAEFNRIKLTVDVFASTVKRFMGDLSKIMQPEEETKIRIGEVKELIRLLRVTYSHKQNQLGLLDQQFTTLLSNLDERMMKVIEKMDAGEYDDILITINKMKKVTQKVLQLFDQLPKLCTLIETVIPEKLKTLIEDVETLVKDGYPLHHLLIKDTISKSQDELEYCKTRLSNFELLGMEEQLLAISDRLMQFYPLFEKEKQSKIVFDQEYETIYEKVNDIEKSFSKLNASLPKTKGTYVIEDKKLEDIDTIQQLISQLNMTKRGLDTLVLSGTKQPYSLQVDKIMLLKELASKAESMIQSFSQYLSSLKQHADKAYQLVNTYYLQFKDAEHRLAKLNIPQVSAQYEPVFLDYYHRLKKIIDALNVLPINMNIVHENLHVIEQDGAPIIKAIKAMVNLAEDTEKLLLLANKERHRTSDNQRIITLAEQAFFEGRFEKAYQEAGNLLKKIQPQKPQK
jgi:septation ring formation regulator EzrA